MPIIDANQQCQQSHNHTHYGGIPVILRFKSPKYAFSPINYPKVSTSCGRTGKEENIFTFMLLQGSSPSAIVPPTTITAKSHRLLNYHSPHSITHLPTS